MEEYHYTECGLDNVYLEKMNSVADHGGEETVSIPAIGVLHRVIAEGIISAPYKMSGREIRFLRTEMGLSQDEMAKLLRVERLTVSRWERDDNPINGAAEMILRLLVAKRLIIDKMTDIEEVTDMIVSNETGKPIRIDGSNPREYRLLAT